MPATTADRVQELLVEKGWSATKLSQMAGLGKGLVNEILKDPGRQSRTATLDKLARSLGVDTEYLACESDARRAGSRLRKGPGWADGETPEGVAPILEQLDIALAGAAGGLSAYHLPPGAEGLGVPADSTVILSRAVAPRTGDLVVVNDPALGYRIRYLAEPYLIGLDDRGQVRHWLCDKSVQFLGKIALIVRVP